MAPTDEFFELVGEAVVARVEAEGAPPTTRHWIIVRDVAGVEVSEVLEGGPPPHEVLDSLIASGAVAAAYATYVGSDPARIVAQVLLSDPVDSDTRRAI